MNNLLLQVKTKLNAEISIIPALLLSVSLSLFLIIILDFQEITNLSYYKTQWDAITRVISGVFYLNEDIEKTISKIFNLQWLLASIDWLPLQRLIIRILNLIISDLKALIYIHFLMMVFALVLPFYSFIKMNKVPIKYTFWVSCFVTVFFQNRIIKEMAYTTHSESLFFFLISLLFYYLNKTIIKDKLYAGLFITIAAMTLLRYEAWLITCSLFLVLSLKFRKRKKNILTLSIMFLGPIIWTVLTYIKTGTWFIYLKAPNNDAQKFYNETHISRINNSLLEFILFLLIPVVISVYIGKRQKINNYVQITFLLSLTSSFGYIFYSINMNTLAADLRYLSIFVFYTFCLIAILISSIENIQRKERFFLIISILILSLQGQFLWKKDYAESYVDYSFRGLRAGVSEIKKLKKHVDIYKNEYFYIYSECCYAELIMLEAELLDERLVKSIRPLRDENILSEKYLPLLKSKVIDKNIPKHIVIIKENTNWVEFELVFDYIFNKYYEIAFESGKFKILSRNRKKWDKNDLSSINF